MDDLATKTGSQLLDRGDLGILCLFLAAGCVALGLAVVALWRANRADRATYDADTKARIAELLAVNGGLRDVLDKLGRSRSR